MFETTRLKLTGWYLVIIMAVSGIFSSIIYFGVSNEIDRGFQRAELRYKAEELGLSIPRPMWQHLQQVHELHPELQEAVSKLMFIEDLKLAKKQLRFSLLKINGLVLFISAITSYVLAGKSLEPIQAAMDEQKRFISDASHELKTPLTALRTSIEVNLRDKKLSLKQAKKLLQSSLEDINGLSKLANNLLNLSNLQQNGSNIPFDIFDISLATDNVIKKIKPLASRKQIKLTFNLAPINFKANQQKIEELITILMDNAIKFTSSKGYISLKTIKDGKHLIIKIKDTGCGISKQDLPHIFDRFYQTDESRTSSKVKGYGLGLALAKKITKLHHGNIDVSSVVGKGTTFTVRLPLNI